MSEDDYVVVGRIGRAHGLKGDVAVEPRTDEPGRRFAVGAVLSTHGRSLWPTLTVVAARTQQGRLVVRFEEVSDRTTAETMRGIELRVGLDPAEVPEDPDEFYDHQLVGLRVESPEGQLLGELLRVEHNAAQDLLVIRTPAAPEVLFPFVSQLVPTVDVAGGRIVVDDHPGLLLAEGDAPG